MTVRVYTSNDAGAPTLNGTNAGQVIAILDACLVNGYGSKLAAGWTKPFSGTNLAVYRSGAGSNQMYLRVDDTATGSSRAARVVGYETMSDVNTGTGPFPTPAQQAGGLYWTSAQSTPLAGNRGWVVVATEAFFYLCMEGDTVGNDYRALYYFGDIQSYKPGDAYGTTIYGTSSNNLAATAIFSSAGGYSSNVAGCFLARKVDQAGSAMSCGRFTDVGKLTSTSYFGQTGLPYPHAPDNGLWLAPIWLGEGNSSGCVRGVMPGMWAPLHSMPLAAYDTFSGTGALAGKTFMAIRSSSYGVFLETSDTW